MAVFSDFAVLMNVVLAELAKSSVYLIVEKWSEIVYVPAKIIVGTS